MKYSLICCFSFVLPLLFAACSDEDSSVVSPSEELSSSQVASSSSRKKTTKSSSSVEYSSSAEQSVIEPSTVIKGSITDPRDGQTYKTVIIGSQTWMAQNLNYETEKSFCYDDDPANCTKLGRLYKWDAAISACPSGWHLPKMAEFEQLINAVGGERMAGAKLKSTSGWSVYKGEDGNGTDDYSFSALPAGEIAFSGNYVGQDEELLIANFWSSKESTNVFASYMSVKNCDSFATLQYNYKHYGFSVRCLKD